MGGFGRPFVLPSPRWRKWQLEVVVLRYTFSRHIVTYHHAAPIT